MMNGSGCKSCPVKPCETMNYRGSACAAQRAKFGLGDPMTNADRIRAMSDEELAKLLLNACIGSKCGEQPMNEYGSIDCFACRMKWLKQPAEVSDGAENH